MALTTRAVTVTVGDQSGVGVEGASVTALLTRADRDETGGWVLPSLVTETTDADGVAVLTLWPNALGSDGSQYRFSATTAEGVLLFDLLATVPDEDCVLAELDITSDDLPPWPAADTTRQARLVQDIADLLQESSPSTETQRKVERWIALTLTHMAALRRWRFCENLVRTTIGPGIESLDLVGDLATVNGLYGPRGRLTRVPLGTLAEARARAQGEAGLLRGTVALYALEAQRRLHLWPAPHTETALVLHYQRPMDLALCPSELEPVIISGVIGMYGRHFDRDALSQDPKDFESRYLRDVRNVGRDSWDAVVLSDPLDAGLFVLGDQSGTVAHAAITLP